MKKIIKKDIQDNKIKEISMKDNYGHPKGKMRFINQNLSILME